ncbi:MAG: hypothetical protein V7704_22415 [Aurantimonas endophytica]|uniref:hypothetical protein n=1 Tax=Aurantimonas endophytica TaxID=1522175 RepID=UPI003001F1E2
MLRNAIQVNFAKSNRTAVSLSYREQNLLHTQARLAGRYALVPDIDLSAFHRKAVIDWVDLGFWLERETQAIHIKRWLDAALHTNCFTKLVPLNDEDERRQTGTLFSVTLQEPTILLMLAAEIAMEQKFGLEMHGLIRAIEISIDFRPKTPSPDARTRMLTVLQRHHFPPEQILRTRYDRPRFTWGKGDAQTEAVLALSRRTSLNDYLAIGGEHDRQPVGDANYYVGRRGGPVMWRLMDKVVDRQNHNAGTARYLPETEKRTRIEVTLETDEVRQLGIIFIDDLRRFRFEKLQSTYFSFMTPTFRRGRTGVMGMVTDRLEEDRRRKFLKTGVIGLREMDSALERRRAHHRPRLIEHLRKRNLKVKPEDRRGRGPFKTYVAYDELNKAVEAALRNLRERGERELKGFCM